LKSPDPVERPRGEAMPSGARQVRSLTKTLVGALIRCLPQRQQVAVKEHFELRFWRRLHARIDDDPEPNRLAAQERSHYRQFFTEFFGLAEEHYQGAHVLDVGCGPMGSLEWADMAGRRVGLDPLADRYLAMGANAHKMEYVKGFSENLPFADESFDIVASFNNLDHVSNVQASVDEFIRVTKPGGDILLITEIDHEPTLTEPQRLDRSVTTSFDGRVAVVTERVFGVRDDHNLYASLTENTRYEAGRPAVLCVRFRKQ
jgi:ubiquinone/menaquinone biosynthesis C-methylase UbiE